MRDALDWIHAETGQRVTATRRLHGGLTSDVHAVTLVSGESLVFRRYTAWGKDAAPQVENERATLEKLACSGIPAPRFVAARPSGDVPMLLMTRLPGRVWLTPTDHEDWLAQMARTLVAIHAVPISSPAADPGTHVPKRFEIPEWTRRRELWAQTKSALLRAPARYTPTFTHSDYQHFNMLWSRRQLSGVVDWVFAGPGHPDQDAAHCRLNLTILFSIEYAERFRELYEAEQGRPMDPWWDLRGLTSYGQDWKQFIPVQVAGRARVDIDGMDARVEGLMERILGRF